MILLFINGCYKECVNDNIVRRKNTKALSGLDSRIFLSGNHSVTDWAIPYHHIFSSLAYIFFTARPFWPNISRMSQHFSSHRTITLFPLVHQELRGNIDLFHFWNLEGGKISGFYSARLDPRTFLSLSVGTLPLSYSTPHTTVLFPLAYIFFTISRA